MEEGLNFLMFPSDHQKWISKIWFKLQIQQMDNNLRKLQYSTLASLFDKRTQPFQSSAFGFGRMWECSFGHSLFSRMWNKEKSLTSYSCVLPWKKTAISFVSFSLHMVPNIAFYVVEKCEINSKLTFPVLENQIAR